MKTKTFLTRLGIVVVLLVSLSSGMILNNNFKKDFVKFDKNLYASPYEVTNLEYREFLKELKATNNIDKYNKCLYDSTQWVKKFQYSYCEPMQTTYHWHPAYDNYPVVDITKEAADMYCEWLTDKYNSSSKKKYKKVLFRLPSEKEWRKLAAPLSAHNLPWYGNFPYKSGEEKTFLTNVKALSCVTGSVDYIFDGGFHTMIVGHYKPNNLGIYDVIGNVAEITQSGAQKGGSWDNYLEECTIDKTQNYTLPDPRVGFRVIMEVVEE